MVQRDMEKAADKALGEINEILSKFMEGNGPAHANLRDIKEIVDAALDEDFIPEGEEPMEEPDEE